MKRFLSFPATVLFLAAALSACSGGGGGGGGFLLPGGTTNFLASGGAGSNGAGGAGGQFYAESYGAVNVLKSGTVNASFADPGITPNFGTTPYIVRSNTIVPLNPGAAANGLYVVSGDPHLYLGNGDGNTINDPQVTGLTINSGATLTLVDVGAHFGLGTIQLDNDLVVYGTVATASAGIYIEANLIDVENGGRITASASAADTPGGEIDLGYGAGLTKTIINRGTIESRGKGSGFGGYIYFEPDDLVVNYGTIDVSGGSNNAGPSGSGGEFDVFVDYGDFYSSGTVRMNGGAGMVGGDTEYFSFNWYGDSCWIETAYLGNNRGKNGDIIISGTWEGKGGNGTIAGGAGGYMHFQTDGMGAVTVNASLSAKGGNGTGAGAGGGTVSPGIEVYSYLNVGYSDPVPAPGTISISGAFDLRGGDGGWGGGDGGYLQIKSDGTNSLSVGSDVELVGFPLLIMNGGKGATSGGNASATAFELKTLAPAAEPITNEASVQAKGGNATGAGGTGGTGGTADVTAGALLTNSGNIDVSGGNGTTTGGNGGNITLTSTPPGTANTGTLSAAGGTGGTTNGTLGTVTVN